MHSVEGFNNSTSGTLSVDTVKLRKFEFKNSLCLYLDIQY
jgi:hypothetical protein